MAKALGLIGNFKGKLGNTVGYSLKDSNNKQTQGVRVYQPVVRNPKTAAQAEQRAKLAPINATYRALKMVIDRGQEGKAYGNKSRLAWLSDAMKAFNGGWFKKGEAINAPALVPLTKGSLGNPWPLTGDFSVISFTVIGITTAETNTIGKLSTAILAAYSSFKEGDQLTIVFVGDIETGINSEVHSFVIDTTSSSAIPSWMAIKADQIQINTDLESVVAGATILSREGDNGAHLRSSASLIPSGEYPSTILADAAKQAAIESYMSQGANTDWAEESLK